MKRILAILAAVIVPVMTAVTVVSFAQQTQSAAQGEVLVKQRVVHTTQGGVPTPAPDKDFVFVASEVNFGGKVVKGAPYSAEAVTETILTLGDGNRIVNKVTSSQYRDSEGRTRREQTIKMLGALGEGGEPLQTIFINDPVAGVTYSLNSKNLTAIKSTPFRGSWVGTGTGTGHKFEIRVESASASGVMMKAPLEGPPTVVSAVAPEAGHSFRIHTESGGGPAYAFRKTGSSENEVKEQLGKQSFDGVEAEGTRTTVTIPAGEIGNERPIQIVSERWYSAELQSVVMTRHSDPRSGETTYRLTNINRAEPDKMLFEVPAGYTVKEGFGGGSISLPSRARKPE
jgi:hypothetical protein